MALIQTLCASDLYNLACRMDRGHNFGYDGWLAIGDYLEQMSDDTGKNIAVDIVGICCEYSIAESVEDFYSEWRSGLGFSKEGVNIDTNEIWEDMTDKEKLEAIENYLQENTSVVTCQENLIIWQVFWVNSKALEIGL